MFLLWSFYAVSDSENAIDTPKYNEELAKISVQFIQAYNQDDSAALAKLIEQYSSTSFLQRIPVPSQLDYFERNRMRNGTLEFQANLQKATKQNSSEYQTIYRSNRTENWVAFRLIHSSSEKGKFDMIRFSPADKPKHIQSSPLTEKQFITELNAYLNRMKQKGAFSGTVLVANRHNVLFKTAMGLASKRFTVSNNIETKFNLGSMNKMFTAVAILKLVEQGKLSLDDTIENYVDNSWLPETLSSQIQIKHLLTHTSGLGNYFNREFRESSRALYREVDDYKPLVMTEALEFKPGTKRRYSNTGMLLLGAVIEKVSKQDYFSFIQENIYNVANMNNSGSYEMDEPIKNLAIGYWLDQSNEPIWRNNLYRHVIKGGPAGGGFSTVDDLHNFAIALTNHKLLNESLTELALSPKPNLNSPRYGYGFELSGSDDDRIVGHGGGFPGISASLKVYLKRGYTVIALSNYSNGAKDVTTKIESLLSRIPYNSSN